MKELIDTVAQKAGLSPEQATTAVQTVVGYLKEKLPTPIAAQLDSVLDGGTVHEESRSGFGGIVAKISDFTHRRKTG